MEGKNEKRSFGSLLNMVAFDEDVMNKAGKSQRKASVDDNDLVLFPASHEPQGKRILIVRGFVSYWFYASSFQFERCHDTIRDRAYFELVVAKGLG